MSAPDTVYHMSSIWIHTWLLARPSWFSVSVSLSSPPFPREDEREVLPFRLLVFHSPLQCHLTRNINFATIQYRSSTYMHCQAVFPSRDEFGSKISVGIILLGKKKYILHFYDYQIFVFFFSFWVQKVCLHIFCE